MYKILSARRFLGFNTYWKIWKVKAVFGKEKANSSVIYWGVKIILYANNKTKFENEVRSISQRLKSHMLRLYFHNLSTESG